MKFLRFNFCHPVKVHATIIRLLTANAQRHSIVFDSKGSNLIEIPLAGYGAGKWRIILDWEYDDQTFTHQKEFEIKEQDNEV
ncbi:MAG: hypothetical protein ABI367_03665 [Mucilaginibacter sp.]